jgi:hypothetical protein
MVIAVLIAAEFACEGHGIPETAVITFFRHKYQFFQS